MSFVEIMQMLSSTGVLAMGVGIFKWSLGLEKRLTAVETLMKGKL